MNIKIILKNHPKLDEHISVDLQHLQYSIENKHVVYRGKYYMKKFYESLRDHTRKIVNFERKKIIPLTNKEYDSYLNKIIFHIFKTSLEINRLMIKNIVELETNAIFMVNIEVLHIAYVTYDVCNHNILKDIYVVFHNGSNYDYHFIIKELAKEFEGTFNCLRENTENYKNFSVSITKEIKWIVKNGEEIAKATS